MKNSLILFLFIAFTGILSATDAIGQVTVEEVAVAHFRQYCEGVVPKKCLVIRRQDQAEFRAVQDEIENFDFIPGYSYVLRAEIEKVAAPPKDTSGWIYRLKDIVSRIEVSDARHGTDLFGTKWRLVRMNGNPVNEASGVWMVFDGAQGRVYGYGGCNSFSGSLTLDEEEFTASKLISTKRACLIDWGVEDGFLKALGQGGKIEVESDSVVIRNGGEELLSFVPYE
ncbi:MAG: META domain-containing protein [Aridibacter famidurans]|nr:META domain-containing protein [Aridibacter famidurans]